MRMKRPKRFSLYPSKNVIHSAQPFPLRMGRGFFSSLSENPQNSPPGPTSALGIPACRAKLPNGFCSAFQYVNDLLAAFALTCVTPAAFVAVHRFKSLALVNDEHAPRRRNSTVDNAARLYSRSLAFRALEYLHNAIQPFQRARLLCLFLLRLRLLHRQDFFCDHSGERP